MKDNVAIILGIRGQDGHYLQKLLQIYNIQVIGIGRTERAQHQIKEDQLFFDFLLKEYQPAFVFHLAAVSSTDHQYIFEHQQTICNDSLFLLESVKNYSPATKVFLSGSALQFNNVGLPIKETDAFNAKDYYSVCRIHTTYMSRYYRSLGLQVYVGYFFNHDSPLRTGRHISKIITEAVKRINAGSDEKLEISDITVVKEWTFAGDVMDAIWLLVNQDRIFEAIIGSGAGYSIEEWLKECFLIVGKDWKDHVVVKKKYEPAYKILISDPSLIQSLGWKPKVSFQQLAEMMMQ